MQPTTTATTPPASPGNALAAPVNSAQSVADQAGSMISSRLAGFEGMILDWARAHSMPLYDLLSYSSPWTLNNTLVRWFGAACMVFLVMAILWLIKRVAIGRLKKFAARTETKIDDAIVGVLEDLRWYFFVPLALWMAANGLSFGSRDAQVGVWLRNIAVIAIGLQLLSASKRLVDFGISRLLERHTTKEGVRDETLATSVGVLRFLAMVVVGTLILLLMLQNMGIEVTPLLTGLGISGIAVALAVQNILGDLFASLTIIFDKPFVVGDYVRVGDKEGTIETIGVKTSRLRAPSGEQLVFSNSELVKSCLHNFKRMNERRVTFVTMLSYETPTSKLREVPAMIEAIIRAQSKARFDRCHLRALGTYAVEFETVYFVTTSDFTIHTQIQQNVNLALLDELAKRSITLAYPTSVSIGKTVGA